MLPLFWQIEYGIFFDFRDQMLRLEAENDMLKERASTSVEVEQLRSQLDAANARNQELQTENRLG